MKKTYTGALWASLWISMFTRRQTRAPWGFADPALFLGSMVGVEFSGLQLWYGHLPLEQTRQYQRSPLPHPNFSGTCGRRWHLSQKKNRKQLQTSSILRKQL